jgi:ParB-like chromosome segregation protein Spo0J
VKRKSPELLVSHQPIPKPSNNPRKSTAAPSAADSIAACGFLNPLLLDGNGTIMAGQAQVAALRLLGLSSAPTVRIQTPDPDEKE